MGLRVADGAVAEGVGLEDLLRDVLFDEADDIGGVVEVAGLHGPGVVEDLRAARGEAGDGDGLEVVDLAGDGGERVGDSVCGGVENGRRGDVGVEVALLEPGVWMGVSVLAAAARARSPGGAGVAGEVGGGVEGCGRVVERGYFVGFAGVERGGDGYVEAALAGGDPLWMALSEAAMSPARRAGRRRTSSRVVPVRPSLSGLPLTVVRALEDCGLDGFGHRAAEVDLCEADEWGVDAEVDGAEGVQGGRLDDGVGEFGGDAFGREDLREGVLDAIAEGAGVRREAVVERELPVQ